MLCRLSNQQTYFALHSPQYPWPFSWCLISLLLSHWSYQCAMQTVLLSLCKVAFPILMAKQVEMLSGGHHRMFSACNPLQLLIPLWFSLDSVESFCSIEDVFNGGLRDVQESFNLESTELTFKIDIVTRNEDSFSYTHIYI